MDFLADAQIVTEWNRLSLVWTATANHSFVKESEYVPEYGKPN